MGTLCESLLALKWRKTTKNLGRKIGVLENFWSFRVFGVVWGVLDRPGVVWSILERHCEVEID